MSFLPYDSRILSFGSLEEKMNREGKRGWCLEKEFFFLLRRNKTEMKKEDYILRWKIYSFRGEVNRERKMRNIFGDGEYVFCGGED